MAPEAQWKCGEADQKHLPRADHGSGGFKEFSLQSKDVIITEWTAVTVIIAIAGLIGTVAVPLTKNTKAMTQLSERINHLVYRMEQDETELKEFKSKAADRHRKIFLRLEAHNKEILSHEGRINALERKEETYERMA